MGRSGISFHQGYNILYQDVALPSFSMGKRGPAVDWLNGNEQCIMGQNAHGQRFLE